MPSSSIQKRKRGSIPQVSSRGRYKNTYGKITYGCKDKDSGYRVVRILYKLYYVHCLVASCFELLRRSDQCTVDHINGDRDDNDVDNLRYANEAEQNKNRTMPAKLATGASKNEPFVLLGEEWRPVPGHEGYQVSDQCRWRTKQNPLTSYTVGSGRTRMHVDGDKIFFARAVGLAFVPRPEGWDESYTIDHVANPATGIANVSDNRPSRLEWITQAENNRRAQQDPTRKSSAPSRSKPVEGFNEAAPEAGWRHFPSASAASSQLGLGAGNISRSIQEGWKVGGTWRFRYAYDADNEDLEGEVWEDITDAHLEKAREISGERKAGVTKREKEAASSQPPPPEAPAPQPQAPQQPQVFLPPHQPAPQQPQVFLPPQQPAPPQPQVFLPPQQPASQQPQVFLPPQQPAPQQPQVFLPPQQPAPQQPQMFLLPRPAPPFPLVSVCNNMMLCYNMSGATMGGGYHQQQQQYAPAWVWF